MRHHHILAALLSLALALTLAAAPALADPLTIDLDTATIEQLQAAQSAIAERINALRAEQASTGESIHHEGSGTSILSGIDVAAIPARLILKSSEKASITLTGSKYDQSFRDAPLIIDYIDEAAQYDALIETAGDWTLDIEPIVPGGSISISGTGPCITDFFALPSASIVTITADPSAMSGLMSNFSVQLVHQYKNIDSWQKDLLVNELFTSKSGAFTTDVIAKPTAGRSDYFWRIYCSNDLPWTITLK